MGIPNWLYTTRLPLRETIANNVANNCQQMREKPGTQITEQRLSTVNIPFRLLLQIPGLATGQ